MYTSELDTWNLKFGYRNLDLGSRSLKLGARNSGLDPPGGPPRASLGDPPGGSPGGLPRGVPWGDPSGGSPCAIPGGFRRAFPPGEIPWGDILGLLPRAPRVSRRVSPGPDIPQRIARGISGGILRGFTWGLGGLGPETRAVIYTECYFGDPTYDHMLERHYTRCIY